MSSNETRAHPMAYIEAFEPVMRDAEYAQYSEYKNFALEAGHNPSHATRVWRLLNCVNAYAYNPKDPELKSSVFPATIEAEIQPFMYITPPRKGREKRFPPQRIPLERVAYNKEFPYTSVLLEGLRLAMLKKDMIRQMGKNEKSYDIVEDFLKTTNA